MVKRFFKGKREVTVIEQLRNRQYTDSAQRDRLLSITDEISDLGIEDIAWMAYARDDTVRKQGLRLIKGLRDPGLFEVYLRRWPDLNAGAKALLAKSLPELASKGWESELQVHLNGRNDKLKGAAEELLRAAPASAAIRQLMLSHLPNAGEQFKRQTLARLLERPDKSTLPVIQQFLDDPDEQVRVQVIEALAKTGEPSLLKLFSKRLEKETYYVQQAVAKAFLSLVERGHDITSHVLPLVSTGDVGLRQTALNILGQMPDQKKVIREFIGYAQSLAGWVRTRALESAEQLIGDWTDPILHLLRDDDPKVRFAAAGMLVKQDHDERVEPALISLLSDPDEWVRIQAVDGLGLIGSRRALPPLFKLLGIPEMRHCALDAIAAIGDASAAPQLARLLKAPDEELRIDAIRALGKLNAPGSIKFLKSGAKSDRDSHVRGEALSVLRTIAERNDVDVHKTEREIERQSGFHEIVETRKQPKLVQLLLYARTAGASDVHISVDRPPMVRVGGELVAVQGEPALDPRAAVQLIRSVLSDEQQRTLQIERSLELCYEVPKRGRYRGSVFLDRRGLNAVFRLIPTSIPTITEIGLPSHLSVIASYHQGLVLVVGPSGSGKTTTLAALVDLFNETRQLHVLTVEDPIEYVHQYKNCLVNQRQIGRDTVDYHRALRGALREDPDVIVLGEMRDAETVRMALEAAETGHLVIGTINGTGADRAVDRLINNFAPEEQAQMRMMLSDTLKAVISQSLIPRADGNGRVAVFEILMGLPTVAAVIRENKTMLLPSMMQTGRRLGMRTIDDSLSELVERKLISAEQAYLRAKNKDLFESLVSTQFLQGVLA